MKIKIFIKSKMSQYSFGYEIIILGKTSVGKSSILNRFIKGTFSEISITQ